MRYPLLYTQQALNSGSINGTKTSRTRTQLCHLYCGLPSLDVSSGNVLRNEKGPGTGPKSDSAQPRAGFLCPRAVFVPRDSAALWRKNQIPNWTPFIGG